MRIGILVGISEYNNLDNLPGCTNDIKAIKDVLNISKEFDEIKVFSGTVNSSIIKSELSKCFALWKSNEISEIFFYFTGHGSFFNNEFYYILTDFDENNKRQTSLQNLEIDSMIKSVKPKMVTKVIDACQSGVSYIKGGTNILEKYYSKTTDSFEKCYFLHSSMTSQYSYQSDDISDFTKSFLQSLNKTNKPKIRYKDIIDFISDKFENSAEQTPFFITQADHTETFLKSSTELNTVISSYIKDEQPLLKPVKVETVKYKSYIEKIKKDAETYSTYNEVLKLFIQIKEIFENIKLNTEVSELYNVKIYFEEYLRDLPKGIIIGKWLEENPNTFFAKPDYEKVSYQEEVQNPLSAFGSISSMMRGNKIITKHRNELRGFEQSVELPFKYLTFDFIPIYPNLVQHCLIITYLISKKDIKIYHAFTNYNDTDWDCIEINNNFKWQFAEFLLKNEAGIIVFLKDLILETEQSLLNILKQKYDKEK